MLSGRAPRQADFFPRQGLIFQLSDVRHRTTLHSKIMPGPSAGFKTSPRDRCSICRGGDIPSPSTHPCWTITTVDRALCTPCVWCRSVGSVLWEDLEMLEVSGNHPTTAPRCCRASVKEMSSTEAQGSRGTSGTLHFVHRSDAETPLLVKSGSVVVAQDFFGWIESLYNFVLQSSTC